MNRTESLTDVLDRLADPVIHRDGFVDEVIAERFRQSQKSRTREVDEQIKMGWGNVDSKNIPKDWRKRRGPGEHYSGGASVGAR
jgi:hypothetical protein